MFVTLGIAPGTGVRRALLMGAMAAIIATLPACGGTDTGGNGTAATGGGSPVFAVQIAALSDSSAARRMSDSLSMAGWQSYVRIGEGTEPHRVRLSPSVTSSLPERVAQVMRAEGMDAIAVEDTLNMESVVEAIAVNNGTHGMVSRVRWLIAPNGRSLIVLHDPAGAEADALPNGFIYASERDGVVFQRDSVWDVAPSPSWNRLLYSQAYIITEGEDGTVTDSVMAERWAATAMLSGMPEDSVRQYSFPVSGMVTMHGYARPVLVHLDRMDSTTSTVLPVVEPLYVSGGWRVRWMPDSTAFAIGDAPQRVQDDSPPRNWLMIDLQTNEVRGTTSQSRVTPLDWRLGPMLDVSVPIDLQPTRPLRLEGATILSGGGWIRRDGRIVGPGVALAATRDGMFIAALAPRINPKEYESPLEPVLYRVSR